MDFPWTWNPMEEISSQFRFKKDKIAPPDIYLGAKLEENLLNQRKVCKIFSTEYIKASIDVAER